MTPIAPLAKDAAALFGQIRKAILDRISQNSERRREALLDYFSVSLPGMDRAAAEILADNAPPLLPSLYEKWIFMFFKRLMETVPAEQLELLCDGEEQSDAAIVLAYVMFLESARMEKQVAEDLKACGLGPEADPDGVAAMGDFIRSQLAKAREEKRNERLDKAVSYQHSGKKSPVQ